MSDEFDWDQANIRHLARHDVKPHEVEEVFRRRYAFEFDEPVEGEDRFLIYGTTAQGRYLTISFTERKGRTRPITAWDMTEEELKTYADQIYHETEIQE